MMLLEELTPEWVPSPDYPDHYQKTLKYGNATIIVVRPILTVEENKKRDAQIVRAAENFFASLERQKRINA